MTLDQTLIIAILIATVVMFLWGRWRHDIVALGSLIACSVAGLIPSAEAFSGFGHPAVITVICVLVLSGGLQATGAIDVVTRRVLPRSAGPVFTSAALTLLAIVLSAFMNNVGALALLMPVAIQVAERQGLPPGKVLMPLAFGSILGGMTTLIGTPPNLIVSGFRQELGRGAFDMFAYTPVGVGVALAGVVFVAIAGRFLVPTRERADVRGFATGAYITEARVGEKSKAVGMTLRQIESALAEADALVVGLIRGEVPIPAPSRYREIHAGDILLIEAEPTGLAAAMSTLGLRLVGREEANNDAVATPTGAAEATGVEEADADTDADDDNSGSDSTSDGNTAAAAAAPPLPESSTTVPPDPGRGLSSPDVVLTELVVLPNADLARRSATEVSLRAHFGINLLAVSRQGRRTVRRLQKMRIMTGDVLLLQGTPDQLADFGSQYGCVPLAERSLRLPNASKAMLAAIVMVGAVGVSAAGLLAPATAFAAGVLAFLLLQIVSPRALYKSIDWPVVVLLGALIPVAEAMASTGAADLIARLLLDGIAQGRPVIGLTLILIVSMTLSDFMNNAATAAVMCPIAIGAAAQLGVSPDPFLMAVAVGASCAFLTPIGHQNNTLILGPGGFHFGDYWRLGLPLEIIVVVVAVPMLLFVWPLTA